MQRKQALAPPFFQDYLQKAGAEELTKALRKSTTQFRKCIKKIPEKNWDAAYAEGKWTLKQLLQHVIDTERVFVFRALSFVRCDPSPLPGFDENHWAAAAPVDTRIPQHLINEFLLLRRATVFFFSSLSEPQLMREGVANAHTLNVGTLGFLCAGHLMHHLETIERHYLAH